MSMELMTAIWSDNKTKGGERLVLLALADQANDEGICWPGISTISKRANLSRRFVVDVLKSLEDKKLIEVNRRIKDGIKTSNIYRVVNPTSLPSEAHLTTPLVRPTSLPSEAHLTTLVRPTSLKSLINHQLIIKESPTSKNEVGSPSPKKKETTPAIILNPVVEALATVTITDIKANYPRLAKEAKTLISSGYTTEDILIIYGKGGAWYKKDWRGKSGAVPQLGLIKATIMALKNNGHQPVKPGDLLQELNDDGTINYTNRRLNKEVEG